MNTPVSLRKSTIRAGRIAFTNESQTLAYLGLDVLRDTNGGEQVREDDPNASKSCQRKKRKKSEDEPAESVRTEGRPREDCQVGKDANNNSKYLQRKSSAMESIVQAFDTRMHDSFRVNGLHRYAEKDAPNKEPIPASKKMRRLDKAEEDTTHSTK